MLLVIAILLVLMLIGIARCIVIVPQSNCLLYTSDAADD